jgi:hypothetical protein
MPGINDIMRPAYGDELKQALGDWLSGLYPWEVYGTYTFSGPSPAARKIGVGYVTPAYADGQWTGYIGDIEEQQGQKLYWVRVAERNASGALHYHALLGGVSLKPHKLSKLWFPRGGNSKVLPYDPGQGAAWYVSKTGDDIDFSGNLQAAPRN